MALTPTPKAPDINKHASCRYDSWGHAVYTCKHCKKKITSAGYQGVHPIRRHLRENHRREYYPFIIKEEFDAEAHLVG